MIKCVDLIREFGTLKVEDGKVIAGVDGRGRPMPFFFEVWGEFWRENQFGERPRIHEVVRTHVDFAGHRTSSQQYIQIPPAAIQTVACLKSGLTELPLGSVKVDQPLELIISVWHGDRLLREEKALVIFKGDNTVAASLAVMPTIQRQ